MKKLFLFLLFATNICLAEVDIQLEVNPPNPVKGDTFQLIFRIQVDDSNTEIEEPYISFDPGFATVQGREVGGQSSQVTIINGVVQSSKSLSVRYDLETPKSGLLAIDKIKVDMGGKSYKLDRKVIKVLDAPARPKDFFLRAEVSKDKVYLGEGIDVRYYLYSRINLRVANYKAFPKFQHFIKRFHDIKNNQTERVNENGLVYERSLQYSARVYPEKIGSLKIDPLKLDVVYIDRDRRAQNQLGLGFSFGMLAGRQRQKVLRSEEIKVEVLPIPAENVPANFTGLVGKHDFRLTAGRKKYLVNEIIELKLEVEGPGALENYEAPTLYSHPALESFEVKSDLNELSWNRGKKTFGYTYLARSAFDLPDKELSFSYFDPDKGEFVEVKVPLPGIMVRGQASQSVRSGDTPQDQAQHNASMPAISPSKNVPGSFLAPILDDSHWTELSTHFYFWANIVLASLLLLLIISFIPRGNWQHKDEKFLELLALFKKNRDYKALFNLLNYKKDQVGANAKMSFQEFIQTLSISQEAKHYFMRILDNMARMTYTNDASFRNIEVNKKYLSELAKCVHAVSKKDIRS